MAPVTLDADTGMLKYFEDFRFYRHPLEDVDNWTAPAGVMKAPGGAATA